MRGAAGLFPEWVLSTHTISLVFLCLSCESFLVLINAPGTLPASAFIGVNKLTVRRHTAVFKSSLECWIIVAYVMV